MRIQNERAEAMAKGRKDKHGKTYDAGLPSAADAAGEGTEWIAMDNWKPDQFDQPWTPEMQARADAAAREAVT